MSSCRFLSQKNQQLWRHQWCRVDSVAACRCTDARCLDAQLRVRCCKLLQPAIARQCHQQQRRMRSDYKEWSSLGRDGCKCAAFHGVLVPNRLPETLALSLGSTSGRIRLRQRSVRKQISATHAKTIAGKRPPRTAPRSASNKGSLSRADGRPTPKAAPGDGLRITTNPLAI